MLQRIEEDFTVAFKQRIEQIKAGNVRWWIQPVIKPSAAGKNLQMTIKQHNDAQPKPERRCGDSGNGHYSHQMIQPAISPDCREYAQRDANQECQQQGTKASSSVAGKNMRNSSSTGRPVRMDVPVSP